MGAFISFWNFQRVKIEGVGYCVKENIGYLHKKINKVSIKCHNALQHIAISFTKRIRSL